MSQSTKTLHEFGNISVKQELTLKTGSTSALRASSSPAPVSVADSDATVTVVQVRSGILVQTPTATRTVTLPTAALMAGFLKVVGDSFDFVVINLGADTFHTVIAPGAGASSVGLMTVRDSVSTAESDIGSGTFKIRQTSVAAGSEAYVVYRIA